MVSTQLENPVRKLIGGEQFLSVPHLSREKETHMVLIYDIVFFSSKCTEMLLSLVPVAGFTPVPHFIEFLTERKKKKVFILCVLCLGL